MAMETDLNELRRRTRAAQHGGSLPLLVIGVVFLNYGIVAFVGQPVEWRYAGALAFIVLWALGKANENTAGVGAPRGDYLAIAAGVFATTQLTLMDPINRWLGFSRLQGVWVLIVGAGLLTLGLSRRDWRLSTWGTATIAVGLGLAITNYSHWAVFSRRGNMVIVGHQSPPVVLLGLAMTIGGIITYERERRLA
jgi:hypothetical protein